MKTWKTLIPLFMVIFVDVMGLCIIFPILAPLFYSPEFSILPKGTSQFMRTIFYSLMLSLWPIFMFISAPILGDLSDKIGRKKVLLLCLFGEAISYLLGAAAVSVGSMLLFLVSRVGSGIFSGSQPIAQAAIADISTPTTKIRNMSNIVLAATLGVVLGPLIGGYTSMNTLVSWFNFSTPFQIAAIVSLLNAILLMVSFHETHPQKKEQRINLLKSLFLFVEAFKQKKIQLLSIAFLLTQLSWSLYFQSVAYFLVKRFHLMANEIGIFYGIMGLASTLTLTYFIRLLTRKISDKHIFILGVIFQVVGAVCAIVFDQLFGIGVSVVLSAIGIALSYTVGISLYSNYAGAEHQGWIMGVSASVAAVSWAVTALLCGPLALINLILPFAIAAIFAALALLQMRRVV